MTSDEVRIEQFFKRWSVSFEELCASFREILAPDGQWTAGPPPIPVTVGAEAAVELLEAFRQSHGLVTIDVELAKIGQSGNVVWTERIDHLRNAEGARFISLPVAGVMTLDQDGRVTTWRDYWDMHEFNALS